MCTVYAAHALGIITRSLVRTITHHKENCVCIKKTQNKVEVDKHRVDTTNLPDILPATGLSETRLAYCETEFAEYTNVVQGKSYLFVHVGGCQI